LVDYLLTLCPFFSLETNNALTQDDPNVSLGLGYLP
jgi:hypothetical protein